MASVRTLNNTINSFVYGPRATERPRAMPSWYIAKTQPKYGARILSTSWTSTIQSNALLHTVPSLLTGNMSKPTPYCQCTLMTVTKSCKSSRSSLQLSFMHMDDRDFCQLWENVCELEVGDARIEVNIIIHLWAGSYCNYKLDNWRSADTLSSGKFRFE